jgi:hypothetical protein
MVLEYWHTHPKLYPLVGCVSYSDYYEFEYHFQTLFVWDGTYPDLDWEIPPRP